jgi:ABC-type amino acid transport substrate-binding protein
MPANRTLPLAASALLAALGLAACGGGPDVAAGREADPSRARGLLVGAAADGPVPLEVDSVPPTFAGGVAEVANLASEQASWLGARFTPTPFGAGSDRRRLVLRFEDAAAAPEAACAGTAPRGAVPPPPASSPPSSATAPGPWPT